MKKGLGLTLLLGLFTMQYAFAQDIDIEFINRFRNFKKYDLQWGDVEGTQYLEKEFLPAKVSINNKIYRVKYNAFMEQMEVLMKDTLMALPLKNDYTIDFVNQKKKYTVYDKEDGTKAFFVILFEGENTTLLAKETIKFYEEVKPKSGYDKYQPRQFKREKDRYYMGLNNSSAMLLSNKKKDFYATFGDRASEVKKYIKTEKLNPKKPDDLIQIFKYFDQL